MRPGGRSPEVLELIRVVAEHRGLTPEDVLSPSRYTECVAARRQVMGILRTQGWSYPRIGRVFGMHHTTVLAHLKLYASPNKEVAFEQPYDPATPDLSGEWAI